MGRPVKDLTNLRFGKLTVVSLHSQDEEGRATWLCRCDCGNEVTRRSGAIVSSIRRKNVRSSCGCSDRGTRPTHGDTGTPEYRTWCGMIRRCYSKTHHKYRLYGARGIRVYKSWKSDYRVFLKDVGRKPSPKHTLDRYPDPWGNYEPGNVRWATAKQQRHNRRKGARP